MLLLLVIALQDIPYGDADKMIIQEQLVNATHIIARNPFTTITSCFMHCSAYTSCLNIGFTENPIVKKKLECLVLGDIGKMMGKSGIDSSDDHIKMYVLLKDDGQTATSQSKSSTNECSSTRIPGYQNNSKIDCNTKICSSYTFFASAPQEINQGRLIGTIETWHKVHEVQLKFKIDVSQMSTDVSYNIIRFSNAVPGARGTNSIFGARIPLLNVKKKTNGKIVLWLVHWVNEKAGHLENKYGYSVDASTFNEWVQITFSQHFDGKEYKIVIKVDDVICKDMVNTHPVEFHDVKIYASDTVHRHTGKIKDLIVKGFTGLKIN